MNTAQIRRPGEGQRPARSTCQATRRHPGASAESCFLPDLTRFTHSVGGVPPTPVGRPVRALTCLYSVVTRKHDAPSRAWQPRTPDEPRERNRHPNVSHPVPTMNAMTTVPTLTLDTSCVIALADAEDTHDPAELAALAGIIDKARAGETRLQLTVSYGRDFGRLKDETKRLDRLAWLAHAPVMERVGGVARFDVSRFDEGDHYASDEQVELDSKLREVLLPGLHNRPVPPHEQEPNAAAKLFSDVDHLHAHAASGAAMFVTLDDKTILKRGEALKLLGIAVGRPSEALAIIVG